jgi:hypothetical protein
MRRTHLRLGIPALAIALLTGCAPIVALEPAADANNPECAEIIVRLPDSVADQPKRSVNAQSTAAWGQPVAIILRCGLEPVKTSALPCVSASNVDWLIDDSNSPSFRFISYARSPATEVIIDSTVVAGITVLEQLAAAVGVLKASKGCTEITN